MCKVIKEVLKQGDIICKKTKKQMGKNKWPGVFSFVSVKDTSWRAEREQSRCEFPSDV